MEWIYEEDVMCLECYLDLLDRGITASKYTGHEPELLKVISYWNSKRPDGNRTSSSYKFKLRNFAALNGDPAGCENCTILDRAVWNYFLNKREELRNYCDSIYSESDADPDEQFKGNNDAVIGTDSIQSVKVRINQNIFRQAVLNNYSHRCCITGIDYDPLLIASHIKPWSEATPKERLDPANGLCLNSLHDKLFDKGLMTLDKKHRVIYSPLLKDNVSEEVFNRYFKPYEGKTVELPLYKNPGSKYLEYHRKHVYRSQ